MTPGPKTAIKAIAVLALIAAACGSSDESGSAGTATSRPQQVSTTSDPTLVPPEPTTPPSTAPPVGMITGELARAEVPYATATSTTEEQLAAIVAGNTEFAFDLLRLIGGEGGNTIISPFSVAAALTMTYVGARDVTAAQMNDVLHLSLPDTDVHEGRNELALRVGKIPDPQPDDERAPLQVNVANSLWGQNGLAFEEEFLETLASAYDAGVRLVDFVADTEGAREDINGWVARQTNDRILDLLPPGSVTSDTRLVLTNAIWFKANWAMPFNSDRTEPGSFRLLDGTEALVPMMIGGGRMAYTEGDGYAAARIGYAGDASMLIIAPAAGRFAEIVGVLDASFLASVDLELSTHALSLTMPKFEFETELSLNSALTQLGMPDAFQPMLANFDGISSSQGDLYIQDVLHKAFISVDEEGTEAAAATASLVGITSAPPPATLTLDNPFIFLIRHDSTGEILFAGTVTDPA